MSRSYLTYCPRCGTKSYEQLSTHRHCIECLHSDDLVPSSGKRDFLTLREAEALIASAPTIQEIQVVQKKVSGKAS